MANVITVIFIMYLTILVLINFFVSLSIFSTPIVLASFWLVAFMEYILNIEILINAKSIQKTVIVDIFIIEDVMFKLFSLFSMRLI